MIDLHYSGTPNGQKVAIMLEETGITYRLHIYDMFEGDQLKPEFGLINPNRKIPAIIDQAPADGGPPHRVFESGAILQYLADKTGRFIPADARGRSTVVQWLTWQMAGLGPMTGQASHFIRYQSSGQEYAIERYTKEVTRLIHVLEGRLNEAPYVGGEDYSIADMAIWPIRRAVAKMGLDDASLTATQAWLERIEARPAVQQVMTREDLKFPAKYGGKVQVLSDKEWSNVFGDAQHQAVRA